MAFGKPNFKENEPVGFQQPDEETPLNKKSAVIFEFPKKTENSIEVEDAQNYFEYKRLGGNLNEKQYYSVLKKAEEGDIITSSNVAAAQANLMAKITGITLSPKTLNIYKILRYEMPARGVEPGRKEDEVDPDMSDQHLLAEALCITGDTHSLALFIQKHPHIFN